MKSSKVKSVLLFTIFLFVIGCSNTSKDKAPQDENTEKEANILEERIDQIEILYKNEEFIEAFDKANEVIEQVENKDELNRYKHWEDLLTDINREVASLYTGEFENNGDRLQINTKSKKNKSFDIEGLTTIEEKEAYFTIEVSSLNTKSKSFKLNNSEKI